MSVNCAKASERVLNGTTRVDIAAASPQLRRFEITLSSSAAMVVNGVTNYLCHTSASTSGLKVIAAYVTCAVAPAVGGGTSTLSIKRYLVGGTSDADIVAAATILSGYTAFIPVLQTLAAANPAAITAGQSIVVTVTTSANVVGTADSGLSVTLLVEHVEDSPIVD